MSSSYIQTRDAASSGMLHATGAAVGSYGAYKAGKAAGKKVNKQALSNAAKRAAEAKARGMDKISNASEKAFAKARSAGRGANSSRTQQIASQKLKELGVDSPKTPSGRDKSYGSRGLSKSQQATLDAARAANADKVGKEAAEKAAKEAAKKAAAKGAASLASKAALPVGVALTAYDVYQAGRRGAGKNDISKTKTHQYGKGGDANYYATRPVATPGGKNKEHIKEVAQRWLPKEASGSKKTITGYDSHTGKPIYGTKRNDANASVQDSKAMQEYRHKRRSTGAYKGNYYGPDQFKGDTERLKDWRKAGSPKDVEGWLASQAHKKKVDNKWVDPNKSRSSSNKSRSSTPTRTDYSTGYGVQR